eukprot:scaffold256074_cov39-Prasinocladus_malaysianus.AAC.2
MTFLGNIFISAFENKARLARQLHVKGNKDYRSPSLVSASLLPLKPCATSIDHCTASHTDALIFY